MIGRLTPFVRMSARRWKLGLPILGMLVAGSCKEPTVAANPVETMELTPPTVSVRAGGTVTLAATPTGVDGNPVEGGPIVWSSSNVTIATVSSSGVVNALSPGEARIAASAMGKSATATVTVSAREVASVVVSPSTISMRVGVSAPLQVQTLDADGSVLTGRAISWASSNSAVATVSAQGTVTGVSAGAATITATSEGRTGQAAVNVTLTPVQTITVSPTLDTLGIGTERSYSAVLRDAAGTILTGRAVAWSSSNVSIATVSSTGVVTGLAAGTTTITASSEGRSGGGSAVVLARLASSVILTPGSSTLVVGATQLLATQVTDAQGNLLTDRPVVFTSDAPGVATVSAAGLVTAIAPGTARITATSEGKTGTATITVVLVPVASVVLTPSSASLVPGGTQQLTAEARSANGVVLTGRNVTWTSGAPGVATVSLSGLVTALSPGVAVILAAIEGIPSTATITVDVPAISTVTITPNAPSITVGASVQLVATLLASNGSELTGRAITWSSADENLAFVSSSGLVVGFRTGTVRITATSEGVSASTFVTVR